MRITDILNRGEMSLSYEVFPPKKETSLESVLEAAGEIAALKPSFMSVTYGAGGGTSEYTLRLSSELEHKYNVPILAHLTCVSSDRETVRRRITELKDAGIKNIMALRGDIPSDMADSDRSSWDYHYAIELIQEIKSIYPECCIGAACYPEIHPESKNQRDDLMHLKAKVDAGVDFLTTQMIFDNNLFFNFLYKLRDMGVTVPVLPGIMPITKAVQVERAVKLSGAYMPVRFRSIVDRFGPDDSAMTQAGIIYATDQIIDLYANGITNVHVYSMNKPEVARGIKESLSSILGREFA